MVKQRKNLTGPQGAYLVRRRENRHDPRGKTCRHYRRYKLTCDEFDALKARAGGQCELCKEPEDQTCRKRLVIDHFEGEGVFYVRGLLCDYCNGIMTTFDGTTTRQFRAQGWEERAKEYEASSWQQPNAEQRRLADAERQRRANRRKPTPGTWKRAA